MSVRAYLITEGVHDVAFIGKLLREALGFERILREADLDRSWDKIVPRSYPHKGSLRPSVPAPSFFRSAAHDVSVAIVNAEGVDEIARRMRTHLVEALPLDGVHPDAVGVVLDADSSQPPAQRFARMADKLAAMNLPRPTALATVHGAPRVGVFCLPGDGAPGTLEDLLLDCAAVAYPTLVGRAVRYVDDLDRTADELQGGELRELASPAGRHKAVLSAMGAVLRPGKPFQATLEDNRWIDPRTLALPRLQAFLRFLSELVQVPLPPG